MAVDAEGEPESVGSVSRVEGVSGQAEPSVYVDTVESGQDRGKEQDAIDHVQVPATTASPASSTEGAQAPDVSSGRSSKKRPLLTRTRKGELSLSTMLLVVAVILFVAHSIVISKVPRPPYLLYH